MSSSGSAEESAHSSESSEESNSSSVVEVSPGPHRRPSSSEGGAAPSHDSDSSFDFYAKAMDKQGTRSFPRTRGEDASDTNPSSPSSAAGSAQSGLPPSGARAKATQATPPSATRRSEREHTPKKHHEDDGYVGVVGGRQVPSGSIVKRGSGKSFTSPLNLASSQESAPSQGGSGGAGASGGIEEDGSAAGDRKKGKGKSRSKATEGGTSTQGGSKLFTRDGEKTALHLLIQEHCPTRYDERKGAAAAWQSIYKNLRDNRITLTLKDKTGKAREVVVDMGPKMQGRPEKEVVKKLKDKWDADRRAEKGKDKDDAKKTGEGATDADEVEETTEDVEQRNAYHAWEAGKSDKKAAKSMKADHRGKGEEIRDDAEEAFNSRLGEGGALGGGSSSGKAEGRGPRGARSRGHGNGKGKSREKRKGTGKRRRAKELSYRQQMERHAYHGVFSGSEGSDGDSDESESTSQDEGAKTRRLDAQETDLASGRGGRATREGKGGGIRKRRVAPLSKGGGGSRGEEMLFGFLGEIMEGKREERAERAAATAGGLGAGGGVTQADLASFEERVTSSVGDQVTRSVMAALRQGGVTGAPQQFPAYPAAGLAGHHPPFPPGTPQQFYPAAGPTGHQASFPPGAPQQRSSFPYPAGTAGAGAPAVAVGVTSGAQGAGGHGGLAPGRVGGGGARTAPTSAASSTQAGVDGGARGASRRGVPSSAPLPGIGGGAGRQGIERGGGAGGSAQPRYLGPTAASSSRKQAVRESQQGRM